MLEQLHEVITQFPAIAELDAHSEGVGIFFYQENLITGLVIVEPEGHVIGPYYTVAKLSELTGYHEVYLRNLFDEGRINGRYFTFSENTVTWFGTLDAVNEYELQKDTRGRPRGR